MFELMNLYCKSSGIHLVTLSDQVMYKDGSGNASLDYLAGLAYSLDNILSINDFFKEVPEHFKKIVTRRENELIIDYEKFKIHLVKDEESYATYEDQKVKIVRGEYVNAAVFYIKEHDLKLAKGLLQVFDEPVDPRNEVIGLTPEKIKELYHTYAVYYNHKVNNN